MDFSQKCFCFIFILQSAVDYCVPDTPLQGAGKQLPDVKADIFCDAVLPVGQAESKEDAVFNERKFFPFPLFNFF